MAADADGPGVRIRRWARNASGAIETALHVIEVESVRLRAMALTYISLFALVPALVVAFSVMQAFTGTERIADRVHEFLFENLAVGAQSTIGPYLDRFIRNAHATSAGLVGGALLVWSAVTLFSNVERAVNDVWGIKRRRSLAQQGVIYWFGLTLGPLLLAGSVTLGHATRTFFASTGIQALAVIASTVLTSAFFALLFQVVPNARVRPTAALAGGLAAGVAWELAKWGYTFAVAKIFRYHAIYGSVAAVPIFLFWLFVSWTILLFGARLAYVVQYASTLIGAGNGGSRVSRELLAGQALLIVARAYDEGRPAPDSGQLATRLAVAADQAGDAISALRQHGLILAVADGGLVPSRPLERLTLWDVRQAAAGPRRITKGAGGSSAGVLASVLDGIEQRAAGDLETVTFRALCDQERASERGDTDRMIRPPPPDQAGARPVPTR
ncbi:YhjD/YihY/BrkB family envelope integrity protein [Anaeromyxobacter oryzisoli]|uniref:YhjD/YihY/BrkB family envelope integrity protein n=1 Tax=Anaeromyxobacter oryzisoli TaxID=2925408 RepID=UPI001F596A11|nr:YhjD/YihY/BrkB family envelope integrity protein [Anaeromyxobacter sp. SG63]